MRFPSLAVLAFVAAPVHAEGVDLPDFSACEDTRKQVSCITERQTELLAGCETEGCAAFGSCHRYTGKASPYTSEIRRTKWARQLQYRVGDWHHNLLRLKHPASARYLTKF